MNKKSSLFGFGLVMGAVAGALGGLFFAPKPGKKLRADVAKRAAEIKKLLEDTDVQHVVKLIFDEASEKTTNIYGEAKLKLSEMLAELSQEWDSLDKQKYVQLVGKVVESVKNSHDIKEDAVTKLKKYLEGEYSKLTSKVQKSLPTQQKKKATKKTTKATTAKKTTAK